MHRFGKKFDHGLLETLWSWRIRTEKSEPRPDFDAMTQEKWSQFDSMLHDQLIANGGNMEVHAGEQHLHVHYECLSKSFQNTIQEIVPKRKKLKFDGQAASQATKQLYEARIRDYNSGRNIEKSDRKAWNSVLAKACKTDYHDWLCRWIKRIEDADKNGDSKKVYDGVKALSGTSRRNCFTQPTKTKQGETIDGPDELGDLWTSFLGGKFSATQLEQAREEYADLGENPLADEDELPVADYLSAVGRMKSNKASGPDGVPAEVFKNSTLAKHELYFFLKQVWRQECVPKNLVLGMFVMIYKRKGSSDDPANYRAIGLLNHAYKILSVCLLQRLVRETKWFLSDWQAGFRAERGCRDNVLLLLVLYDHIIANKKHCVVTHTLTSPPPLTV